MSTKSIIRIVGAHFKSAAGDERARNHFLVIARASIGFYLLRKLNDTGLRYHAANIIFRGSRSIFQVSGM